MIYAKGIPLYTTVQKKLDTIVRIMRENITGIRVVKALSKEDAEKTRYAKANEDLTNSDITAAVVMAVPGPLMQMCLNIGLSLVVLYDAYRVNSGAIKPGVILAFLTYFNMITMGVMGLSRIFVTMSKASASAERIALVMNQDTNGTTEAVNTETCINDSDPTDSAHIIFDHVSFNYGTGNGDKEDFNGAEREKALNDISFTLKRGESLGIIGPTGSGKTTIINLLMRFYDVNNGKVYVDDKEYREYTRKSLRKNYAMVLQDTWLFQGSIYDNIAYGKEDATKEEVVNAATILVVNNGDVVEQGNHDELMAKRGFYYNLYASQFG